MSGLCFSCGPDNSIEKANNYYNQALYATRDRRYQEAIQLYEKALAINPKDPAAYYNMGIIYDESLDNPSKAIFCYQKYLELSSTDAPNRDTVKKWIANCQKFVGYDRTEFYEKREQEVRAKIGKYFLMRKEKQFGAVKITKKTTDYDGGAEYEWYFQEDGSGDFLKDNCKYGKDYVFERYKTEKTGDNEYNVTDIGSIPYIKCGPFAVIWSSKNWIYLNHSIEIAFTDIISLEKINVFDKNLEWLKLKH